MNSHLHKFLFILLSPPSWLAVLLSCLPGAEVTALCSFISSLYFSGPISTAKSHYSNAFLIDPSWAIPAGMFTLARSWKTRQWDCSQCKVLCKTSHSPTAVSILILSHHPYPPPPSAIFSELLCGRTLAKRKWMLNDEIIIEKIEKIANFWLWGTEGWG